MHRICLLAVGAMSILPLCHGRAWAQCRTATDTASAFVTAARHSLSVKDSAQLVSMGMPFKPASVTLVTDSATCAQVIGSFNQLHPPEDSLKRVTMAFVVQADSAFVVYVPQPGFLDQYFYFDRVKTFKFALGVLK